jgi:glycine cleavage system H protein
MGVMIPKDLKYTEEHEWVHLSDDGTEATVGITDFAQKELGDIVYVEMPQEGDHLTQMESFGTIEAVKTVEDLYAPLTGEVLEVNAHLTDQPTLINTSPYEDGWIVRLRIANPKELDALLSHEDYRDRVSEGE